MLLEFVLFLLFLVEYRNSHRLPVLTSREISHRKELSIRYVGLRSGTHDKTRVLLESSQGSREKFMGLRFLPGMCVFMELTSPKLVIPCVTRRVKCMSSVSPT